MYRINLLYFLKLQNVCDHQKLATSSYSFGPWALLCEGKNEKAHLFAISAVFVKISTRAHRILGCAVGATG